MLPDKRLHDFHGQPVPVLCHPTRKEVLLLVKKFFFLCFSLRTPLFVLSLGNTEESGTVFLTSISQIVTYINEIPSILFSLD